MSKLIGAIVALGLALPAHAGEPAPLNQTQEADGSSPGKRVLARLDARVVEGSLDANGVAAILFSEEVDVTAAVLDELGRRQAGGAYRADAVERLVTQVPGVAAAVLALPDLSEPEGIRVAGVALEVLKRRGARAGGLGAFADVLEGVATRSGAEGLGRAVQGVVASVAADNALDGAGLLELVNAARPSLSLDILQSAATGLAGDALAYCLHRGSGMDGSILNQLQRTLQLGASVNVDHATAQVLPFLESERPFERSEAALVLGRIGNRDQVEPLINALADSSKLVRTSTLAALHNLTGMTISGDCHRWTLWLGEQRNWWAREGQALVSSLRTIPRKRLVHALSTVATKRLYRTEITAELVGMLNRNSTDEVRAVISALGALRDPESIPALLKLRESRSVAVRVSVEAALQSMRKSARAHGRVGRPSTLW